VIAALAERRQVANDERVAGRYAAAEAVLLAAMETASATLGASDVMVAVLRNDLAVTYKSAGRLAEAETLYSRSGW
jgi:Tetratricopeptide repeat